MTKKHTDFVYLIHWNLISCYYSPLRMCVFHAGWFNNFNSNHLRSWGWHHSKRGLLKLMNWGKSNLIIGSRQCGQSLPLPFPEMIKGHDAIGIQWSIHCISRHNVTIALWVGTLKLTVSFQHVISKFFFIAPCVCVCVCVWGGAPPP